MEDQEADVGVWNEITPPAFIPISSRAKAHIDLPEPCDGLLLMDTPERVFSSFPDDYKLIQLGKDDGPSVLAVGSTMFLSDLH